MRDPAPRRTTRRAGLALAFGAIAMSGCAGAGTGPVADAVADTAAGPDAPVTLDAAALVPGADRADVLERLAGLGAGAPACETRKIASPGSGRAFLHERCRLDWADPSPVRWDAGAGEPPALRTARVDLVDGTAVRVDLRLGSMPSAEALGALDGLVAARGASADVAAESGSDGATVVLVDARLTRALPELADARPAGAPAPEGRSES